MNAENADLKDFSQRKSAFISVLQRFWLLRIKSIVDFCAPRKKLIIELDGTPFGRNI